MKNNIQSLKQKEQDQRAKVITESLIAYLKLLDRDELEIIYLLVRELARKN